MTIDSTFWVAVSFLIFFGGLIYLKVPQKINEILNKLINEIKNEIDNFFKEMDLPSNDGLNSFLVSNKAKKNNFS